MDAIQPQTITDGVVVSLDYELTVDGEVVDSTANLPPLDYLQGFGNIIPGLEHALNGMTVGETREVSVPASKAYGEYNPEWVTEIERELFPDHFALELGAPLHVRDENGRVLRARITAIGDTSVTVDMNHVLAGKELFFKATVAGLRAATPEELEAGRLGGSCSSCGTSSDCSGSCC